LWRIAAPFSAPGTVGWPPTQAILDLVDERVSRAFARLLGPDFFGTSALADFAASTRKIMNLLWAHHASTATEEVDGADFLRQAFAGLEKKIDASLASELWESSYVTYPDFPIEPFVDTLSTLEELKGRGLKIAVLTNSPWQARIRRPDLDALGL